MTFHAPRRPPGDRSHLERLVQALSVDQGIATDRLRRWVSTMVLLGALGQTDDDEHRFLLKGGVALELRLRLRARATRDVDLIVRTDRGTDVAEALKDALAGPYLDFDFRVVGVRDIANTPAQRMDVKLTYKSKPWATLLLEASPPEGQADESEQISAFSLTQLGLDGPDQVACQSLRYQMATKLHAVTQRFATGENDRFRDLIDLLLLRELDPDLPRVKQACLDVFHTRATHPWPPQLTAEPSWPPRYHALAVEQEFSVEDVEQAVALVQDLIDEIDRA